MAAKKKAKNQRSGAAPCEACKGFAIPARRVRAVARKANGQFKKQPKQRGLF